MTTSKIRHVHLYDEQCTSGALAMVDETPGILTFEQIKELREKGINGTISFLEIENFDIVKFVGQLEHPERTEYVVDESTDTRYFVNALIFADRESCIQGTTEYYVQNVDNELEDLIQMLQEDYSGEPLDVCTMYTLGKLSLLRKNPEKTYQVTKENGIWQAVPALKHPLTVAKPV